MHSSTMYRASVLIFIQMLNNLSAILDKAAAHAQNNQIDPAQLTQARLYPDMLPLTAQVQIATDTAKGCAARLAGETPPVFEDTETSFPELQARIQKTIAFLNTVQPAQLEGSETRHISLKLGGQTVELLGEQYLHNFVYPNFYFHVTTAYGILRHLGVNLGKADFLGKL